MRIFTSIPIIPVIFLPGKRTELKKKGDLVEMEIIIDALKKMFGMAMCRHDWKVHVGVQYLDYAPYSFYECEKCHKKKEYR